MVLHARNNPFGERVFIRSRQIGDIHLLDVEASDDFSQLPGVERPQFLPKYVLAGFPVHGEWVEHDFISTQQSRVRIVCSGVFPAPLNRLLCASDIASFAASAAMSAALRCSRVIPAAQNLRSPRDNCSVARDVRTGSPPIRG